MESLSERYFNPLFSCDFMKNREFQTNLQAIVFNIRSSGILQIILKNERFAGNGIFSGG
jgi:hypothetical protein